MKKSYIKLFVLLLLVTHFSTLLQAQESLYMHTTDGRQQTFLLETIDKITFPHENVLITFNSPPSVYYLLSEIQYLNFTYIPEVSTNSFSTDNSYTVRVFPNPTKNEVSIVGEIPIHEIIVYDAFGQKLMQVPASPDKTILSLSDYPSGFYMLQIMTSMGIVSEKIIKN
jgi:hypothetical protein